MPTALETLLKNHIRAHGPLTVEHYMQQCLYHPAHGYYTTGRNFSQTPPTDFTTAPELTPLFGYTLAEWVAIQWKTMGKPNTLPLIEVGPGRGTLMRDLLTHLQAQHPAVALALQPWLVEISPGMAAHQKQTLKAFPHCQWADKIPRTAPKAVLIANELLDAFPARQFIHTGGTWHERTVALDDAENLAFGHSRTPASLILPRQPDGTVAELNLQLTHWLQAVPVNVETLLLCDYGAAPATAVTFADTLQALHAHQKVSPLHEPGQTDLTTHVNFTAVLAELNFEGKSLEDLAPFLLRHGLTDIALQHPSLQSSLQRLLHPAQMGTLFKVLCCTRTSP